MAIIYSYPQGTPTLSDNVIGSQIDPITEENKTVQFTVGQIASFANSYSLGYTVYTALLTQAGTAAPVATILQNTTGKTFTYARTSGGDYTITASSSLFTANKTYQITFDLTRTAGNFRDARCQGPTSTGHCVADQRERNS